MPNKREQLIEVSRDIVSRCLVGNVRQVTKSRFLKQKHCYFDWFFNDRAGNDERAAYIFDTRRVSIGPKIGELAIVESDRKHVKLPGISRVFHGFNRNPFLASFTVESTDILLANCHLLYGPQKTTAERKSSMEKRQLEAYAIARWCDLRRKDKHAWTNTIIALGDFNLPTATVGDPIFDALTKRGLRLPPHTTKLPTNVSNSADYDQIEVTPGLLSNIDQLGVFGFDGAIFPNCGGLHHEYLRVAE